MALGYVRLTRASSSPAFAAKPLNISDFFPIFQYATSFCTITCGPFVCCCRRSPTGRATGSSYSTEADIFSILFQPRLFARPGSPRQYAEVEPHACPFLATDSVRVGDPSFPLPLAYSFALSRIARHASWLVVCVSGRSPLEPDGLPPASPFRSDSRVLQVFPRGRAA